MDEMGPEGGGEGREVCVAVEARKEDGETNAERGDQQVRLGAWV